MFCCLNIVVSVHVSSRTWLWRRGGQEEEEKIKKRREANRKIHSGNRSEGEEGKGKLERKNTLIERTRDWRIRDKRRRGRVRSWKKKRCSWYIFVFFHPWPFPSSFISHPPGFQVTKKGRESAEKGRITFEVDWWSMLEHNKVKLVEQNFRLRWKNTSVCCCSYYLRVPVCIPVFLPSGTSFSGNAKV